MQKMSKRRFRIGELAKRLQLARFVIRFWEQEFQLPTWRSLGKQRYYQEKDALMFSHIKNLLYTQGYTIHGAKKELINYTASSTKIQQSIPQNNSRVIKKTLSPSCQKSQVDLKAENELLSQQITALQSHLKKLQNLL